MGSKPREGKAARRAARARAIDVDPDLFLSLTEGERADALRLLTEDKRLNTMAKVGRYRVVAAEPLVLKPPHERAGRRLARVVVYDYASDARLDVALDLDAGETIHIASSKAQPVLSAAEEAEAARLALASDAVQAQLVMGERVLGVMHYWSRHMADRSFRQRTAAVLIGAAGATPSVVAVVDLVDREVTEVVPAGRW
jgi:hypothetical protein